MGANRKRVKVHMLPTDKPSFIAKGKIDGILALNHDHPFDSVQWQNQHLYFTTSEKIKEGDPVVWNDKVERAGNNQLGRKIIATTDPKLIKDGVAQIPQAFIEKYCRVGGIDEVDVEYENTCCDLMLGCTKQCKGSIRLELKVSPNNEITIHPIKDSWTREEVVALCSEAMLQGVLLGTKGEGMATKFIEFVEENL